MKKDIYQPAISFETKEVPLIVNFLTKASILEKLVVTQSNDHYNTSDFERIPFYKPISQTVRFIQLDRPV